MFSILAQAIVIRGARSLSSMNYYHPHGNIWCLHLNIENVTGQYNGFCKSTPRPLLLLELANHCYQIQPAPLQILSFFSQIPIISFAKLAHKCEIWGWFCEWSANSDSCSVCGSHINTVCTIILHCDNANKFDILHCWYSSLLRSTQKLPCAFHDCFSVRWELGMQIQSHNLKSIKISR